MMRPLEHAEQQKVEEIFRGALSRLPARIRRPRATYRLQFNRQFTFAAARALVPYLARLGISDVYASPYLKASPGSTHGYDVVDHHDLNPEVGTPDELAALVDALRRHGMGHVLDFVPNHMAIGHLNPKWMDVLENGPASVYAPFFDIDWSPVKEELKHRVLVPILGDQYGAVLERGELKLVFENGGFTLTYFDHRFPITPRQYTQILRHRLEVLEKALPGDDVDLAELLSIVTALEKMPTKAETDPRAIAERHREKEVVKRRLNAICEKNRTIGEFVAENVRQFNGTPGDPRSFDLLDNLLREQAYRLAFWRVAAEEINYRRFFDINNLAAIRMEDPRVFKESHALVFDLIADGRLDGLRIDHPDGLYYPPAYFAQLQEEFVLHLCKRVAAEQGLDAEAFAPLEEPLRERYLHELAQPGHDPLLDKPLFVVVEKILAHDERTPSSWRVHGTTGYEFLTLVNGLFVDRDAEKPFDELTRRFTGQRVDYEELVYQKKRQIMADSMASEMNVLAKRLARIAEHDRRTRDFTHNSLRRALIEVVACFPVYRTYLSPLGASPDDHDRHYVDQAMRRARRKNPTINSTVFDFIRDLLLRRGEEQLSDEVKKERLAFVLKLQQVTAPVMAKGVEDTTFYLYNRLVSLNEVGGEPNHFGTPAQKFHEANLARQAQWPYSLLATSTHDTKRSEDVRARIDALSELGEEWKRRLSIWSRLNRRLKRTIGEAEAPDRNEELLLYQALLGVWPNGPIDAQVRDELRGRVQAYLQKAMKEGKVNTSWLNPSDEWESAVLGFVADLLDPAKSRRFLDDFLPFQQKVARIGALNSLAQVLLKCTCPGVPDVYQGQELWDYSLVDPDNRRPVDYAARQRLLESLDAVAPHERPALCRELYDRWDDGRIKLFVLSQALRQRKAHATLFAEGEYLPIELNGAHARRAVAFARRHHGRTVIVVVPRLVAPLLDVHGRLEPRAWEDTFAELPFELENGRYRDVFSGRVHKVVEKDELTGLPLGAILGDFPLAMLVDAPYSTEELREPEEEETSLALGEDVEPEGPLAD